MDKYDFVSLILYYGRIKFFRSMQRAALDGLAKYPAHVEFRLFNGIALALGYRVQEAIRELNPIKNEQELSLAAILALIYSHMRCNVIDKDALAGLEIKLKDERRNLTANSAYYAAVFLFLTDKVDKARDYTDRALKINDSLDVAIVLKVWIQLAQNTRTNKNAKVALEKISNKSKNIDASLAEVKYFQLNNDHDNAISVLNKLSACFPELNIPLVVKMETQLAAWDWDQAFETALRIINLEPMNISALRVKALVLFCREGNIKAGVATLQQLLGAAERVEAGNSKLIIHICILFSRLCSRNKDILNITHSYVTKIVRTNFDDVEHMTELGYQNILSGYNKDAVKCFRSATKIDNNFFLALCGLTLCQIMENGGSEQARQQIELLGDLKGIDRSALLLFLISKITKKVDRPTSLLIEATEIHLNKLIMYPFGAEYLLELDPDFLLQIVADLILFSYGQVQPTVGLNSSRESLQMHFKHCNLILETVLRACPAHLHANYMKAKIAFFCGDLSMAVFSLNRIITSIDETFTGAYLLLSQIQIQQEQFTKALQSLEICLSHNFSVRDNPLYHLFLGIVQKEQQQYSEAKKSFLCAMQLIGSPFGSGDTDGKSSKLTEKVFKTTFETLCGFSLGDKATLYLELIDVYSRLGEHQEAGSESERLLHIALEEFTNTPLEGKLVLAHAEIMVRKGHISKAIDLLSKIKPSQIYYTKAKTQLAYIYLHEKKDRVAFAKCFKQLVDNCPKPESYLLLGEAYMSIQEPDLAVEAYEQALQINPNDSLLAGKLGRAYVKTHQYAAAIKYYHEAVNNPDHSGLKLDLAELYLKLRQYEKAAEVLTDSGDKKHINESDLEGIQFYTKELLLLARIQEKFGNISLSLQTLNQARENQLRIFKRILLEKTGNLLEQNKMLSKICFLIGQQYVTLRENDRALTSFKECLKYTPSDVEVLVSLARLYMQVNSMDLCRDVCTQILHMDSNNEAASVMMADMSFRKMDFENAAYHFSQLLISQPCYWTALARLIEVMRRSGTLSETVPFLQRADQASPNASLTPGLTYCKGLYEWYCGNPNGALKCFNAVRRDYEWGQQAIFNMITICINPDGDLPSLNDSSDLADSGDLCESRIIALRMADRLLKELRPHPGSMNNEALNYRMLHNFLLLASKQKFQTESALQDFTELASKEDYQNLVGPVLGMAISMLQLKQTQRAKNQLKRIARMVWNFEEAEYLERSWLLLADIYINSNKLDVAQGFINRVMEHNKSCTKAYEYAGFIAEKNQAYRDAAKAYNSAWIYGGRSKPHMGYKLAYNYMKIKRYADAIDVCQQVIKSFPDYSVIKKDILEKCRNYLRP